MARGMKGRGQLAAVINSLLQGQPYSQPAAEPSPEGGHSARFARRHEVGASCGL